MRPPRLMLAVVGLMVCQMAAHEVCAQDPPRDPALVLHYTFDTDPGETAKDQSTYGNDGEIVKAHYLEESDGRRGVLRFDGKESVLTCPQSESGNRTITISGRKSSAFTVRGWLGM